VNRHIGLFEVADGGTLFLDEIGELPLDMQVKLLRVLQEGEFTRVGGRESLRTDIRLIAATNRSLETMVQEGTFRADLYYRLAVIPIIIPPLRERPDDIPLLATAFVQKFARQLHKPIQLIPPKAMKRLTQYGYPGNVRELENLIERAVVLCDSTELGPEFFPIGNQPLSGSHAHQQQSRHGDPQSAERRQIIAVLEASNWIIEGNRGAALKLGMKPSTLRGRMAKLRIVREDSR
jgi:formate hydrogenlyase transcriptional activator